MDKHKQNEVTRMRFSPTKILQGLLCTTPIFLLTLAACGGGGGDGGSPTVSAVYTLGGAVTGVNGTGLVLRNNGGDSTSIPPAATSYTFATQVASGSGYNVSVFSNPSSPTQKCTFSGLPATGNMPAYNMPDATGPNLDLTCVNAFTIGGAISVSPTGPLGTGLVLQDNLGDNLLVPAGATSSFTFATPVADTAAYSVTVLTQPHTPAQTCVASNNTGNVSGINITTVSISCTTNTVLPTADPYVYAANLGSTGTNGVSTYTSTNGVLSTQTLVISKSGPSSIAVDAGKFAYVANANSNSISAYSISAGALTALTDVDAGTSGTQTSIPTGTQPYSIAIHPSGKFAYVANAGSNSISAYSIDATTGALARIDADGFTSGNQTSIPARSAPISIAIDPTGSYAYVANAGDNNVSVYSIDASSGALTAIDANGSGAGSNTYISTGPGTVTPFSVTVDPSGTYLYVANRNSNNISIFQIGAGVPGTLSTPTIKPANEGAGATPVSIAIHPEGVYAYVLNTDSGTVNVYTISGSTLNYSSLASTGATPSSISIDSTGQYAYVANYGGNSISAYAINQSDGSLSSVSGSPFATGSGPNAVTTAR
jgi:6-phosphogluconolactonase